MSENNQSTVSCMIGGGSGVVQQGVIAAGLASRDVVAVLDELEALVLLARAILGRTHFDAASINYLDSEMAPHETSGMTIVPSFLLESFVIQL